MKSEKAGMEPVLTESHAQVSLDLHKLPQKRGGLHLTGIDSTLFLWILRTEPMQGLTVHSPRDRAFESPQQHPCL